MNLDENFIFRFLKQRNKKLTKTYIATYLHYDNTQLSKKLNCEPKYLYKQIFDLENPKSALYGEDESTLLGALHDYIERSNLKSSLDGVWDKEYKDFVIEFLTRAMMQFPKEDKSPAKKNHALPPDENNRMIISPILRDNNNNKHLDEPQDETQFVQEMSIADKHTFSQETVEIITGFQDNPDSAPNIMKAIRKDFKRPITLVQKKKR